MDKSEIESLRYDYEMGYECDRDNRVVEVCGYALALEAEVARLRERNEKLEAFGEANKWVNEVHALLDWQIDQELADWPEGKPGAPAEVKAYWCARWELYGYRLEAYGCYWKALAALEGDPDAS